VEEHAERRNAQTSMAAAMGRVAGTTDNLVENIAIDPIDD
jgi:hypothetical protein